MLVQYVFENIFAWFAVANRVGEENLVEALASSTEVFDEVFRIYHVAIAEHKCAVMFVNFWKKQLVFALEIDNERVPCFADLFVGNVSLEDFAKFVAKLGGCNKV